MYVFLYICIIVFSGLEVEFWDFGMIIGVVVMVIFFIFIVLFFVVFIFDE